ncbi:MAG TPA: hypothetical protein VN032_12045, partial [Thermoanaerobaculia bacterium]|nr:hypothetical protein [Thermoanaerobaculia bacterium]
MPKKLSVLGTGLLLVSAFALGQAVPEGATGPNRPATQSPGKNLVAGTSDTFTLTIGAWDMQVEDSTVATAFTFIDSGAYLR